MASELVFLLEYCPAQYPKPDYQGTSPSGSPIFAQCNLGDPLSCRSGFYCQPSPNLPGSYYCCQQDYGCPGIYSSAEFDQGTNFPRSCGAVVTGPRACGPGYECIYSSIANQQICCSTLGGGGGTPGNYCPNGGQVADFGGGPQRCSGNNCPVGYSCQSGYCCTVQSQGYCPIGSSPALDGSGLPIACGAGAQNNNCPAGYACVTDYGGSFCCSFGGGNPTPGGQYCPAGSQPYMLGNGNGNALTCSPYSYNNCPPGYSCQAGPTGSYYCCTTQNGVTTQYCPQGTSLQNGHPTMCDPSGQSGQPCFLGYTCQNSGYSSNYYCCSGGGASPGNCPYGSTPYSGPNTCSNSGGVGAYCAPGYNCQQGAYGLTCCSCSDSSSNPGAYCPPGSNPLYQSGGYPESCYPGYNSCGDGYSCQTTGYGGKSYCCSVNGGNYQQYCPYGCLPWFYPGTNSPLSCSIGISRCPGASTCMCPNGGGSYGARGYCCGGSG